MNAAGYEPCPYCRNADVQVDEVDEVDKGCFTVCCDGCGGHGPVAMNEAEAVRLHNQWVELIVPTLQRGNAAGDAPASQNTRINHG